MDRLTVDAYAVQHRGDAADSRAGRSVWLHFAALAAVIRSGQRHREATADMRRLTGRDLPPLPIETPAFPVTLADIVSAGPNEHVAAVARWAASAYAAWRPLLLPSLLR